MTTGNGRNGDFRFADFEVDSSAHELRKGGVKVHLEVQPFQVLLTLLERQGEVVTRDELKETLWAGDTFVDFDNGVNQAISKIRRVLKDSATRPRFIETIPRVGYRFVGRVDSPATVPSPDPVRTLRKWVRNAGVGFIGALAGVVLYNHFAPGPESVDGKVISPGRTPVPAYEWHQLTHDTGVSHEPSISKDGSLIAYSSNRAHKDNFDIWVRQTAGGNAWQITSHEAADRRPTISPDGKLIAFESGRSGGGIYVKPTFGGSVRLLASAGHYPQVSPDGRWVAYSTGGPNPQGRFSPWQRSAIFIVPIGGGDPRRLDTGTGMAAFPTWSPDSKHILFLGAPAEQNNPANVQDWWVVPAEGGQAIQTGAREVLEEAELTWPAFGVEEFCRWLANPDRLVFGFPSRETENLFQLAMSRQTWKVAGPLVPLTRGLSEIQPATAGNGRIAFTVRANKDDIWSVGIDVDRMESIGEPKVHIEHSAFEYRPTVSFDGKKLVFNRVRAGNPDVLVWDSSTSVTTPLVVTPSIEFRSLISPDGNSVAFVRGHYGKFELFVIPTAGGIEKKIADNVGTCASWAWDSRRVICSVPGLGWSTIDILTGKIVDLFPDPDSRAELPALSPDGKWVSFQRKESDSVWPIYVAPIRGEVAAPESEWLRITNQQMNMRSRWMPSGDMLYFASDRDGFHCLWARHLDPNSKRPLQEEKHVFGLHDEKRTTYWNWPMALSQDRFYFWVQERASNIWFAEPVEPSSIDLPNPQVSAHGW